MDHQVIDQPTRRRLAQPLIQWLILAVLLCLLVAAESVALHAVFTSKFSGGNDFFVRWLGGREFLLRGTNPYHQVIAEKAQIAMFGRAVGPEIKDQAYFAYPLYTLYFFWPLSLIAYPWAQAIWIALLQLMLIGTTLWSIWVSGWRPPRWLFWLTLFWGIFFYNGARAIILGQFSVLVGLALVLALWCIQNRQDVWAGIFLSLTTIKPQMVVLGLAFLLLWALFQRRWRLIGSFVMSVLILVTTSMLMLPTWPFDFVRNAIAYSHYVAFGTPLENLLLYFLPVTMVPPLTMGLSVLFFLALLPGWWLALRGRPGAYTWAVMTTLIVGSLITFRSATTNQVILYLPLFFFFQRLMVFPLKKERWSILTVVGIQASLFGLMWGVFMATLEGNWEHVMMHGLLPALMLLLYAVDWRALWRAAAKMERPA